MLPAMHQACADTTGALWSSRTITVRPLPSVVICTPGGIGGMSIALESVVIKKRSSGKHIQERAFGNVIPISEESQRLGDLLGLVIAGPASRTPARNSGKRIP